MSLHFSRRLGAVLVALAWSASFTESSTNIERQRQEFSRLAKDADDAVHNDNDENAIRSAHGGGLRDALQAICFTAGIVRAA